MSGLNQIYLGDCLELMKRIPSESIDMILCDLPYGTTACKWDTIIPFAPLWEQYGRIIKDNGAIVLTAAFPFSGALWASNPKLFKYDLVWHKSMPSGITLANKRQMKYHENILVFYKNQPVFNKIRVERSEAGRARLKATAGRLKHGGLEGSHFTKGGLPGTSTVYEVDTVNPSSILVFGSVSNAGGKKIHSTQKPESLFENLIKTYTNEGDIVLDNCIGSGTTAIAAINTNRQWIGMEKDAGIHAKAVERVNRHLASLANG